MRTAVKRAKNIFYETRALYYRNIRYIKNEVNVGLGARRLFFAQTYKNGEHLMRHLADEKNGEMNFAVYVQEPQFYLHHYHDAVELDPSLCYRLDFAKYQPLKRGNKKVVPRPLRESDVAQVNKLYSQHHMFSIDIDSVGRNRNSAVTYFVAEREGQIVGVVIGINHVKLFNSPEKGSSLWGLAVALGHEGKGVGKFLINYLVDHYQVKGLHYMDLYVDFFNKRARRLYKRCGFQHIPRFSLVMSKDYKTLYG